MNLQLLPSDIEAYLKEVKKSILSGHYAIARNRNRSENEQLFLDYVLSESTAREILLSLTVEDFSEIRFNRHPGYEHELLYIFGKDVRLLERFGSQIRNVSLEMSLYI
ncbi:hypothetical protein [uncultured Faecalibaculum sp.]|uniref:hypothetical protein n=1 Tax=uncultured Faecalibaculum sp. TaxID=1729681 RepID=UPI002623DD73|nr:hypothetical protein [uncultured Faecalibaculum sp.]